ncbi:hypothetical protein WMY93_033409 [Mugilogobius chulae]|uniref:IRG-type G domain-containing protein n=1 Tax=Mugilogobius chulae TaxID=88201 RepID=A0AAW0MSX9_9GOBI
MDDSEALFSGMEDVKTALQNNNFALAAARAQKVLEEKEKVTLVVAITGETGSGKSSLINAIRGIGDKDKAAAPVGVVETTKEPVKYSYPNNPNITLWDLPGIGTPNFTAKKYVKEMDFKRFDFFIIVSDTRFRENDAKLALEIQKMKKKFYFIRTKIDNNIRDAKRTEREFNEEQTLNKIRDNCVKNLKELQIESPKVFLVSSADLRLYDFSAFCDTLEKDLPGLQQDVLLLVLPNISLDVINKKKKELQKYVWVYSTLSAGGAGIPIPVGVVETTMEPVKYIIPTIPTSHCGICLESDHKFPAEDYVEKMEFEKFDLFIIVSADRFRENDAKLALEIQKMKKKFYFIRSKIDNNIRDSKELRGSSMKNKLFDKSEMAVLKCEDLSPDLKDVKTALQNGDLVSAAEHAQKALEEKKNATLTIAITGESGSGKSSLVNALRGISDKDEAAAPVDVVETTDQPMKYTYPNNPNITLWDLPGIGTTKFPAEDYVKKMEFEKFDFFIIVSDTRFSENDVKLALEIQKMKKKFYFIRSKIDHNIRDAERTQKRFNKDETLSKIRDDCIKNLEKLKIESPKVFLVSSAELHLYDFSTFYAILEKELPDHQREALLLALPNLSLDIINKKKKELQSRIWIQAAISAAGEVYPFLVFLVWLI